MSITVAEKWDSRRLTVSDRSSAELNFLVQGTDESLAAVMACLSSAPPTWNGLPLKSADAGRIAEQSWDVRVSYNYEPQKDDGASTYSFDTTGGTGKLTTSLRTVGSYVEPGKPAAPNFKGLINVTDDGCEGVEIDIPIFNWEETHYINAAAITGAYKAAIYRLTATTNRSVFRGYEAGEVLFKGARGSLRRADQFELTFKFAASPNKHDFSVGDINNIDKKGWEYIWVRYESRKDDVAKKTVKQPVAVYVEQVYEEGDFENLNIGS